MAEDQEPLARLGLSKEPGQLDLELPDGDLLHGLNSRRFVAFSPSKPQEERPDTRLDSDLIPLLFLTPLLCAHAFHTSWDDLRPWLRPIVLLSTGLVAATTIAVGAVATHFALQFPWSVAPLLDAVVSRTNTVAGTRSRAHPRATALHRHSRRRAPDQRRHRTVGLPERVRARGLGHQRLLLRARRPGGVDTRRSPSSPTRGSILLTPNDARCASCARTSQPTTSRSSSCRPSSTGPS